MRWSSSWRSRSGSSGRMAKRRIILALAFFAVVVAWPTGRWVRNTRPWESATERAYRTCSECGLDAGEVDRLIDTMRHSALTREQGLELFFSTFDEPAAAELCVPCAETIMHAAGPMENGL